MTDSLSSPVTSEALAEAFEFIRLRLINCLEEPGRSAFWKAVEMRDALTAGGVAQATPEAFQLQTRKPDRGIWTDIYPAQLGWCAKEGYDVRALELTQAVPTPQDLHDVKVLLTAIYDLIDDEEVGEPLDYAIAHAKKALSILGSPVGKPLSLPSSG